MTFYPSTTGTATGPLPEEIINDDHWSTATPCTSGSARLIPADDVADTVRAADAATAMAAGNGVVTIMPRGHDLRGLRQCHRFVQRHRGRRQPKYHQPGQQGRPESTFPVPTWEAPCTMRVYLGNDGSHALMPGTRRLLGAVRRTRAAGPHGGKSSCSTPCIRPFVESGELIVSFTLAERRAVPAEVGGLAEVLEGWEYCQVMQTRSASWQISNAGQCIPQNTGANQQCKCSGIDDLS